MGSLDRVKRELTTKLVITLCFMIFVACVFCFSPANTLDLLAATVVFGLLFIIFLIGILSDLKALKHYKRILKDNQGKSELKEFYDEKRK